MQTPLDLTHTVFTHRLCIIINICFTITTISIIILTSACQRPSGQAQSASNDVDTSAQAFVNLTVKQVRTSVSSFQINTENYKGKIHVGRDFQLDAADYDFTLFKPSRGYFDYYDYYD